MKDKINFELSRWEARLLLGELEQLMCVINRNNEPTYRLYEIIASQFYGEPVRVQRPEKKIEEEPDTEHSNKKWFEFWKGK